MYLMYRSVMLSISSIDWCSLLQNLAFGRLRKSKVHHFVHQLIYDDKIVPDGLFLEFLKVLDEDLREAVEK